MAFITSEQVKEMRNMIKKAFPTKDGWKWSVTKEHHSSVRAALMEFPDSYDFSIKREGQDTSDSLYSQLNFYYLNTSGLGTKEIEVMEKVKEILHTGHWDESDIMTDYFNCSHYVNLHIGKWDRPAKPVAQKVRKAKPTIKTPATTAYTQRDKDFLMVADFIGIEY